MSSSEAPAQDLSRLRIDRGPRAAGPRRPGAGPGAGRLLLLILALGTGYLFRRPLLQQVDAWTLPRVALAEAFVPEPGAAVGSEGVAANGYVVARKRAALSAEEPGRIVELLVEEGSRVRAGDVVARLDSAEREALVAGAEAALADARLAVGEAEARLAAALRAVETRQQEERAAAARATAAEAALGLAAADLERVGPLTESGVEPPSRLDQVVAAEASARAELDAQRAGVTSAEAARLEAQAAVAVARVAVDRARAGVQQREAERDRAAASLEKLSVRAPFDGMIVLKDAEVGEVVSPNSQGASSRGAVATLVDLATLEVQVELPETNLAKVELGAPATLVLDAFPREPMPGRVDRIWPTANRQKATIEVRLAFDTPDPRVRPDMGVRVVFGELAAEPEEAKAPAGVQVVASALVTVEGTRGVFVFDRGQARFRAVDADPGSGATVEVRSGLEAGEQVLADPPYDLRDGDRVLGGGLGD